MPELIEVEIYRRAFDGLIGGVIDRVELRDPSFVRPRGLGSGDVEELAGFTIVGSERCGKVLVVELLRGDEERTVGLRFGMTGRLIVDGIGAIEKLEYASAQDNPSWDRLVMSTSSGWFAIRDQRRLGNIDLDPDLSALGPDASTIDGHAMRAMVEGRTTSIKALMLNQSVIAGLGNLLVDEALVAADLAPGREAGGLSPDELDLLASVIRETVAELLERGGSHTGDLFPHRCAGGVCPVDGEPLTNSRVGGRGTWWCPHHQG